MANSKRLLLISLAFLALAAAQFKKVLTNEEVLAQGTAGTTESDLLQGIESNDVNFDTSADALIALKNAGMSDRVVLAILSAARRNVAATPAQVSGSLPSNPGVYLLQNGRYAEIAPESFTWKPAGSSSLGTALGVADMLLGSGQSKSTRSIMSRRSLSGSLPGSRSRRTVSGGAEFIIICPEGVIGAEYRLVRIDEKSGRGEFSVSVQYVANTYFGISAPGIEAEKIAARTYRIKLPELKKGQYGFLAPGTIDADSAGTVHAFEVL